MERQIIHFIHLSDSFLEYKVIVNDKEYSLSSNDSVLEIPSDVFTENGNVLSITFSNKFQHRDTMPAPLVLLSRILFPEVIAEDPWPGQNYLFDFTYSIKDFVKPTSTKIIIHNYPFDCESINLYESGPKLPKVKVTGISGMDENIEVVFSKECLYNHLLQSFRGLLFYSFILILASVILFFVSDYTLISGVGIISIVMIDIVSIILKKKEYDIIVNKLEGWVSNNM